METADKQDAAIREFGAEWLVSVQASVPSGLWAQGDFPVKFTKAKESLASGMPQPSTLPPPFGLPSTIAPAVTNGYPSIGNAASGPVPSVPSPAPTPPVSGISLPFSAAIAGKHIKIELPKPRKFTRIAADSDIQVWLLRVQEYLSVSGIDQSLWVVFASNFLENVPLSLWEARKVTLAAQPDVLYSWDTFRQWCLDSFSVHNHEKRALAQLEALRQTGSVAEYKAAHNVLAARTNPPMQLRISWWERGLNPAIAAKVQVDPLTYKEYTDIDKAQSAACALDAHEASSAAAAHKKRPYPPTAASARVEPRAQRPRSGDFFGKPAVRTIKWTGDSAETFTCPDVNGKLAEPLRSFFQNWIQELDQDEAGRAKLPFDLCPQGSWPKGACFYKRCLKPGHAWRQCPLLARHVARKFEVGKLP